MNKTEQTLTDTSIHRALIASDAPSSSVVNSTSSVARYEELQALVQRCERDFVKAYIKGNKEAGIRLRKQMQQLRAFAKTVRDEVRALHGSTAKRTPDAAE